MNRHALVIGASRGLGLVLVDELLRRGWYVVGTTRSAAGELQTRTDASQGRLSVDSLEMTDPAQLEALRRRLADHRFDLLFVNAGIDRGDLPIGEVPTAMFTEVMITNALSPLRVLEGLRDLVVPGGTVAVMSSEQGSISRNTEDGYELYKASKAALNQLVRSYATRHHDDRHTKLLIDPGHNQTRLGGPAAVLRPEDSIRLVVDVLDAQKQIVLDAFAGHDEWRVPEILDSVRADPELYFDSISQIHLDTWHRGRVVLVGDAAHCASGLSGRGTSLAITGTWLLAQAIHAHDGDLAAAFDEYETRQRPHVTRAQASARPGGDLIVSCSQHDLDVRNARLGNLAVPESQGARERYSPT